MLRQISPVLRNVGKFSRISGNHDCMDRSDKSTIRANLEQLGVNNSIRVSLKYG